MNKNDTNNDESSGLTAEGEREATEIQHEIAQTRAEMSGTIDQIHGKLNPTVLKEQAVDQFLEAKDRIKAEIKAELSEAKAAVREATVGRVENMVHSTTDSVKQTSASLLDTVKRNPIPAAMVGVGAVWLLMRSRNGAMRAEDRLPELDPMYELGDEPIREPGARAGRQSTARIKQVRQAASERMQATGERVQRLKQDAQERGRRLEYRAEGAFQENPLLVGAAVVAAGALVGLAIPITRREDGLMGKTRDGLMQQAQTKVQGVLDKAQSAAKRLGDEAAARTGGGNGGNLPSGGGRSGGSGSLTPPR